MHDPGTGARSAAIATGPAPQAASRPAAETGPEDAHPVRRFGLVTATALVMGNIIGGGIFLLPASVAPFGSLSLLAFVVLTVGAIALALVFGRLARRDPRTGGPYVYAREAFGDFAGFLSAWSYWVMTWVSNAALAVAAVGYVRVVFPGHYPPGTDLAIALLALWLPALANLAGTRWVGAVQIVSTVLKFLPLLFVAFAGLFFFDPKNLGAFDPHGGNPLGGLSAAAALLLYSYVGVESAAVSAGEVRDPARNVGRATVLGTIGAAVVYLLGTVSVFGTVPHGELVTSTAPFSAAVDHMVGGHWGGTLIAAAAVVSIVGALNGWTLMSAQAPYAAARDGLFPARFARRKRGVPTFGVLVGVVLATALTVINYTSGTTGVFNVLVLITTFSATVPYLLAAAAQLYWLAAGERSRVSPGRFARDVVLALGAFAFSMWLVAGAGYAAVYQGVLFLFAGVLVFVVMKGRTRAKAEAEAAPAQEV
ncbi:MULTISPECIES: amino acid permease [Streptomycetaceae]|uniref:ABC transporter permease protein n=1 Tax=Streptantibioticus cattleyicolor (strain ATCC 35852 / DSM 46488 / JCM 4925 / NBRC 14057 / NRRL 8057) TaxID=1003195 RepID=F8JYP0_STREN|nr:MULTISPECIES: amino acid permease [Streptomycetaceae]AEW97268.1 ABC transporter permease protein [Streptantibioticus cattleyicolor NRRL 8057 = DSM 46488]MYS61722.1 amino acid permease [Streptomyces sp. SID5468]CCB77590.1 putative integral membrane transport protein [Streptantibioticus cattleyicolor NRRL 8057 = DSM 46488]